MQPVIMTDVCADLPYDFVQKHGISVLPMKYVMDDVSYTITAENMQADSPAFFERLRAGVRATTNQVNPQDFAKECEMYLSQGRDVIYIAFSSALSGSFSSATQMLPSLREKFPDRHIVVVDSLCASAGQGLLIHLLLEQAQKGLDVHQLAKWVEENRLNMAHWFTVGDLGHLKRGGRVTATAAFIGTILSIKPVMHVDNEGRLVPVEKAKGRKHSMRRLAEMLADTIIDTGAVQHVYISHGDCQEDAEKLRDVIIEAIGPKQFTIVPLNPIIGAHSGPDTLALFFYATGRGGKS